MQVKKNFARFLRLKEGTPWKISFSNIKMKVDTVLHNYQKIHNFLQQCWLFIIFFKNLHVPQNGINANLMGLQKLSDPDNLIQAENSDFKKPFQGDSKNGKTFLHALAI